MEKLLEVKKEMKKKKPSFDRHKAHKLAKKRAKSWRKPKGLQNKMRLNKKGYARKVKEGYRSPKELRHASTRTGLKMCSVCTITELSMIDPQTTSIIISASVGNKKRAEIIKQAINKKITIANIKDPAKYVADIEGDMKKRAEGKKKRATEKEEKKKELEKVAKEKKKEKQAEEDGAEKKEKDKKELDKVLTTKGEK